MRPEEVTALGDLADEAAAGLTSQIREMHRGIAARAFGAVGAAAAPARLVHDRIAACAYGATRVFAGALLRGGAAVASLTRPHDSRPIDESPRGRLAVGALNGACGDGLHRRGSVLALKTTVRRAGRDVPTTPAAIGEAFPDATGRLALFVHGLCETDDAWKLGDDRYVPYGARLQSELGYTPLYVRYNTGRHVSENGRELGALLERLVRAWPVEVREIALIGHSMGGSSDAAPATTRLTTSGRRRSPTCSCSGPRTSARRWRRRPPPPPLRLCGSPRPADWHRR